MASHQRIRTSAAATALLLLALPSFAFAQDGSGKKKSAPAGTPVLWRGRDVESLDLFPGPGGTEATPLETPPVDSVRVRSADEAAGWAHRRTFEADLNGDGTGERVVLTADVQLGGDGEPLWEDGHRWAVFVEDRGQRTLLYAAFVPNGHAEAAVLTASTGGRRHVLIQERTPQQARSLVVRYERPGVSKAVSATSHQVERWLPGLANR